MNKIILNKDNTIIKPKKKFNIFYIILGILLIGLIAYSIKIFAFSNNIGIKITPDDIINPIKKDPELKRDSSGKLTNALIVGIDTRNASSDLRNTDTMILASYNHETNNVLMLSIPRDFYVKVPNEDWYTKINGIYQHGENNKVGGMNLLKTVVQEITGYEIQYYGMVDLQGFVKIVDTVGGVTVNVENSFIDYRYPREGSAGSVYETISFTKGVQNMNGTTALKYARSRQSINPLEGSDFARARRQQKVIVALKDKILSSETLLNPSKVLEILNTVEKNVKLSEFTSEDIQALVNLAQKQKENKSEISSFVLDPSIANSTLVTANGFNVGNLYVIGPKAGLNNYTEIKKYFSAVANNPILYSEDPTVMVYNTGLGDSASKEYTNTLKKKYPYINIQYLGTLFNDKTGNVIYSHSQKEYLKSLEILSSSLDTKEIGRPTYIKNDLNGENITILLGKQITNTTTE